MPTKYPNTAINPALQEAAERLGKFLYPTEDVSVGRCNNPAMWKIGYSNDYSMQHRHGQNTIIDEKVLKLLNDYHDTLHTVAVLSIQSNRYRDDADFKQAVDNALFLTNK